MVYVLNSEFYKDFHYSMNEKFFIPANAAEN